MSVDKAAEHIAKQSWFDTLKSFRHPRVITMLFLGFSAGVPILLIFSSLSLWLREAGVSKSMVTFFSWAALGYSFKFVWAPLVDRLPVPFLTRALGRRRSWMLISQFAVIAAIVCMAMIDPGVVDPNLVPNADGEMPASRALQLMAMAAVALGFSSATQDIVIDAYRIESAESELQALMSSTYIAGYRIGMVVAGAGVLFLAQYLGSTGEHYSYAAWMKSYLIMAAVMLVGVATTLMVPEPTTYQTATHSHSVKDQLSFFRLFLLSVLVFVMAFRFGGAFTNPLKASLIELTSNKALSGLVAATCRLFIALAGAFVCAWGLAQTGLVNRSMVRETYFVPVLDFFERYGIRTAIILLLVVGFYRVSDIVLGVIANVFYEDMGYTKAQIAEVSKVFGLLMTVGGGMLGGILAMRYGVMRILILGAILSGVTNLLFMMLAKSGVDMPMLYLVIAADNLSAGLAMAAFIAFLSSLTNVKLTAVQYAIFSSIMTLFPKALGGYSGTMVESMGYPNFFMLTALMTIPVVALLLVAWRYFDPERQPTNHQEL